MWLRQATLAKAASQHLVMLQGPCVLFLHQMHCGDWRAWVQVNLTACSTIQSNTHSPCEQHYPEAVPCSCSRALGTDDCILWHWTKTPEGDKEMWSREQLVSQVVSPTELQMPWHPFFRGSPSGKALSCLGWAAKLFVQHSSCCLPRWHTWVCRWIYWGLLWKSQVAV